MTRPWLAALLLCCTSTAAGFENHSYGNVNGWKDLHSWCDTTARVLAATAPTTDDPMTPQPTTLAQWTGSAQTGLTLRTLPYQLGPTDAGAGQLYTVLTPAAQPVSATPTSYIHSSNIENVSDPTYRMTHINGYVVPAGTFTCRYVPQAAVLAATAKHSLTVWEHAGHVTYASRNRNGTPGTYLTGGTHTRPTPGTDRYEWSRGAFRYVLDIGRPGHPGGSIRVLRGGVTVSQYPLLAYTVSLPH